MLIEKIVGVNDGVKRLKKKISKIKRSTGKNIFATFLIRKLKCFHQNVAGCASIAAFSPILYPCKKLLQTAPKFQKKFLFFKTKG